MTRKRKAESIIIPFATKEAAEENLKKIRNPKSFEKIGTRWSKEKERWEVVLVPLTS